MAPIRTSQRCDARRVTVVEPDAATTATAATSANAANPPWYIQRLVSLTVTRATTTTAPATRPPTDQREPFGGRCHMSCAAPAPINMAKTRVSVP